MDDYIHNHCLTFTRHLMRRPNNSIGYLEELKIRTKSEPRKPDILQVFQSRQSKGINFLCKILGNHFIHFCKQDEIASFVVADLFFHYSSYYKKILAKQHEMNDSEGDTTEYIHDPRYPSIM